MYSSINEFQAVKVSLLQRNFPKKYYLASRFDVLVAIFPPCQSELYQHMLRTAYIAHLWSHAHRSVPSVTSPLHYGWKEENNKYTFKWFDGDQVPPSVTGITINDENPAENFESDVVDTSEIMEEDDAEELEEERNLIINSSDDSYEESDGNDTDTAEDAE